MAHTILKNFLNIQNTSFHCFQSIVLTKGQKRCYSYK